MTPVREDSSQGASTSPSKVSCSDYTRIVKHISRKDSVGCAGVLVCFCLLAGVQYRKVLGDDLTSSFVSCRLLAAGQGEHLYDRNGSSFDVVSTTAWLDVARQGGVHRLNDLHPFVQIPLWPLVLEPLCTHVRFSAFYYTFLALNLLCASGMIWVAARSWTSTPLRPLAIAVTCGALLLSEPFKYYFFLGQTHLIFLLLSIAAVTLDRVDRTKSAGICLGIAAAIKLTPAILILYWIGARRWSAALWATLSLAAIYASGFFLPGRDLMGSYLLQVNALSHSLLPAMVNQSIPSWIAGLRLSPAALFDWTLYPLPSPLRVSCGLATLLCGLISGYLDRNVHEHPRVPYGAILALIGSMMLSPIAWTHYYVILLIPSLLCVD